MTVDVIWNLLSDPAFLQAALAIVLILAMIYGILVTANQDL